MAALLTRNDGECHLQRNDKGFYEYFRSPEQVRIFTYLSQYRFPVSVGCTVCNQISSLLNVPCDTPAG